MVEVSLACGPRDAACEINDLRSVEELEIILFGEGACGLPGSLGSVSFAERVPRRSTSSLKVRGGF